MTVLRFVIANAVIVSAFMTRVAVPSESSEQRPQLRRPVSLAMSADGKWLYSANRDSGSISVVNISTRTVAAEIPVGGRLADIAVLDDARLLVLDEQHHRLVLLAGAAADWKVATELDVPHSPVQLQLDQSGKRCFVSSLWSQTVTMVDLSEAGSQPDPKLRIEERLRLPFAPRQMCLTADGEKLIVAGSFQARLAVVETDGLKLLTIHQVPGHNIRGLAISGDGQRLLMAQQELNPLARSTRDDVHWGNMISNLLVSVPVEELWRSEANIRASRDVHFLGEPGNAAGDPGPVIVGPEGRVSILLSGVSEIAVGVKIDDHIFRRTSVGLHPVAAVNASSGRFFVVNMFSDSISIVESFGTEPNAVIPLGPQRELSDAERGEMLFYDSRMSHDGWMSCHSCHTDGHTNGHTNDNLSDGSFGAPKRVLSLLGVADTGPWAWNGHVKTLEDQLASSITNTMQGSTPSDEHVTALAAYLKTLPAPPVPTATEDHVTDGELQRGEAVFKSLNCQRCHAPPTYTSPNMYDVGLVDESGNKLFNPPSLRGVGRRTAFFHDGKARSLEDVVKKQKHQLKRDLSAKEQDALLHFLRSL